MNVEFMMALDELVKDRGIDKEVLLETIEAALVAAYKKNFSLDDNKIDEAIAKYAEKYHRDHSEEYSEEEARMIEEEKEKMARLKTNVRVELNRETGDLKVFTQRMVVDESDLYDTFREIELAEARKIKSSYELGDIIELEVTPKDFGRIAAQTAKQIVVQKIREAEREMTYKEFVEKQDELVTGEISRISNKDGKKIIFVQIGKGEGILLQNEQIAVEDYKIGTMMKFYVVEVNKTNKNPQIIVSRTNPGLVKRLFEMEVPEIQQGVVQIMSISREAGSRTKMAVRSIDEKIDPIGACVGTQGSRVRNIVEELGDEKIDIVKYSDDTAEFVEAALSPSKVTKVFVNEKEKSAVVIVPDYQLSLAIGKEGQNARLAARLTNWKIDIKPESEFSLEEEAALIAKVDADNLEHKEELERLEAARILAEAERLAAQAEAEAAKLAAAEAAELEEDDMDVDFDEVDEFELEEDILNIDSNIDVVSEDDMYLEIPEDDFDCEGIPQEDLIDDEDREDF